MSSKDASKQILMWQRSYSDRGHPDAHTDTSIHTDVTSCRGLGASSSALLTEAPMRRLHRALEPQLSLGAMLAALKECSPDVIFVWKTPGSDLTRLVTYPGARGP